MSVFVDTGVLFAAAVKRDRSHARATQILASIASEAPFTTDHVLVETWMLIASRASWAAAMRFWNALPETPLVIDGVTLADLERARAIATEWADRELDVVDCTSFAVMERLGCRRAASFDTDFAVYRFGADRRRAFEIVR